MQTQLLEIENSNIGRIMSLSEQLAAVRAEGGHIVVNRS
jgi:hypothetical protein